MYGQIESIIPHSPWLSFMRLSHLISMKIHLSTKQLYWSELDNVSFMVPRRPFFCPQSHPTDSITVCNRPHSFDIDTSREMLGSCSAVHQEEWSWFTGGEYALNIKAQWTQRQMQLGQNKNPGNKVDAIQVCMRGPEM